MPLPTMTTPKLLLSKLLRRRSSPTLSSLISSSSSSSSVYSSHISSHSNLFDQSHNLTSPKHILPLPPSTLHSLSPHYNFLCFHFFPTRGSEFSSSLQFASVGASAGADGDGDGSEVAEVLVSAFAFAGDVSIAELILSVHAVVSLLDYCHDFTGLPWWVIIASSTLVLRITLLPMLILQLKKLKKLAELFPKLPPPLPPPLLGKIYIDQLSLFRKEKLAVGCASYLWFLAYFSVQVSFRTSSVGKYCKLYLEILTLPIMFIGFCVPQGSLVYWLTNSSLTLIQLSLLAKGHKDRAIPLLRLALEKDPDHVRGLVVMGQTLLQSGQLAEATEYLKRAISKERHAEGIKHLERVANLKEPKDSKSKAHYYDAFILLARYELGVIYYWSFHVDTYALALLTLNGGSIGFFRAFYKEGHKAKAAKYLRIAVVYDFVYNVYLEQCENDDDKFASDLISSRRRGDY